MNKKAILAVSFGTSYRQTMEKTISSIENGKYNPSLELAFAISDFFQKSIEDIFIYERGTKK